MVTNSVLEQATLRESVSSTKTEATEVTASTSSYVYQSEEDSDWEEDNKRQRKKMRKEPTRWDGSGSFHLEVNDRWIHDGHDMSSTLLDYTKLYLKVGTECSDRPGQNARLGTVGSFLFVPTPLPHLEAQDVLDIYDVSSAFREKDSAMIQDYLFSGWAKNRPPSDLLRRLVTNYAQVEALWTRSNDQNEDTYMHNYFMPIFNCLQRSGVTRHLSQAFEPSNSGIKSDLHLVANDIHIFVCEGKKPTVSSKFDFEKIALEMKDSIDDAITNGKRLERMFGCQVKDDQGELFTMELKAESIYLMRSTGYLQELNTTFEALDKDAQDLKAWIRPSFELPRH
ncbi:hypothetical protein BGW41_003124 [Actinomortierella wolfii]|nr:hypothetical protein BGW41_003124 [Actinomortierella wolfii]